LILQIIIMYFFLISSTYLFKALNGLSCADVLLRNYFAIASLVNMFLCVFVDWQ